MTLPTAVARQAEEAERLLNELRNTGEPAPEKTDTTLTDDTKIPDQTNPLETPEVKPALDDWEQKYRALKGKYDAEVPRLAEQIRNLNLQNQFLADKMGKLESAPPKTDPEVKPDDLDKAFIEEYGEDLVNMVKRIAAQQAGEATKPLASGFDSIQKANEATKVDRFFSDLTGLVPDWETLNINNDFLSWLDEIEPFVGQSRYTLLSQAQNSFDAQRVAYFFNTWKEKNKQVKTSSIPANKQQPAMRQGNEIPKGGDITFTAAEIENFYKDYKLGRIPEDEARRIENEIMTAASKGNII